jgi:SAM-dependent methyltransferase
MEGPEARVSDQVARLIATCSRGWERFFADHDDPAPRFVPSVPERVWAVLVEVTTRKLPPTRVFCEWGSGFGTATCLAALLGYEAYGLEIDEELVRLSRAIARRLGIRVTMLCTSLFPAGYAAYVGVDGAALVTPASVRDRHDNAEARGPLRYDGMEIAIADIGLFFVYPWPEERELMRQLFEAVAREGAILVVYHTDTDIGVFRKVEGEGEL